MLSSLVIQSTCLKCIQYLNSVFFSCTTTLLRIYATGKTHYLFRADRAARYEMEKKEKEEAKQQRQQAKEANEREELARLEAIKRL